MIIFERFSQIFFCQRQFAVLTRQIQVDHALITAAAKQKAQVAFFLSEPPVDQNVRERQKLQDRRLARAERQKLLIGIARIYDQVQLALFDLDRQVAECLRLAHRALRR